MGNISSKIKSISEVFNDNLTGVRITNLFYNRSVLFITKNATMLVQTGIPATLLTITKNPNKLAKCIISAIPFCSKEIYERFRSTFEPEFLAVWDELLFLPEVNVSVLEKRLGLKIYEAREVSNKTLYYYTPNMVKTIYTPFLTKEDSWSSRESKMGIPAEIAQVIVQYHSLPEYAQLRGVDMVPNGLMTYESGVEDLVFELPRLTSYVSQNLLASNMRNKPSMPSVNKMHKKLNLKSLYPNSKQKDLILLRSYFLGCLVLQNFRSNKKIPQKFKEVYTKDLSVLPFEQLLFIHLKGSGRINNYWEYTNAPYLMKQADTLLRDLPTRQWLSIENIIDYVYFSRLDFSVVNEGTLRDKLYYSDDDRYMTSLERSHGLGYHEIIVKPSLLGILYMLGSFGFLDLAYSEPDISEYGKTATSAYEGLKYIRTTALLDYVLERTDTIEIVKTTTTLQLSEHTLTITFKSDDVNATTLLEPFAFVVSNERYATSATYFLKDCQTRHELESKVDLFKKTVDSPIPKNWEKFLNDLLQNSSVFTNVTNKAIVKVDEKNKELIALLHRDIKLKSLCERAENFQILVEKQNISAFKARLKELGYLV